MNEYEEQNPYGTYDAKGETSPYSILNQMKSWNKEIRLTVSDGFEQTASQISILDDEIALRVEKDSIIQSINLSGEGLKINVSKMDISGLVTISALSTSGQTVIHGGNIMTDTILADSIFVNNLSTLSTNLGTISAGTINGIAINGGLITSTGSWGQTTISQGTITQSFGSGSLLMENGLLSIGNQNVNSQLVSGGLALKDEYTLNLSASENIFGTGGTISSNGEIYINANVRFGGSVAGLTVPYATNAGNADTLDGYTSGDFSLSGHTHSSSQYVKPSSGQAITLGATATQLNVYVNGSLQGSIPYA